ncbi:MAG: hypothetical protein U5K69_22230 [Balneolaceae bacterium]|nr:hypothetical protein [Balneolaceae bacterium]
MRLGQFLIYNLNSFSITCHNWLGGLGYSWKLGNIHVNPCSDWPCISYCLSFSNETKREKNDEAKNKKLGIFFNWVIVISGFVILILIVLSQTYSNTSYQNQSLTNDTKKVEEKDNSDGSQVVTNNYDYNNGAKNKDINDSSSKDYAGQKYYESALELEKKQEFQSALNYLNKAIELSPDFAKAYEARGVIKYVLQDWHGALRDHQKAIELDPHFKEAYVSSAFMKKELGYSSKSICRDIIEAKELGSDAPLVTYSDCFD